MDAHASTLTFPGVVRPIRGSDSSTFDRRAMWAPPAPAEMVFDESGAAGPSAALRRPARWSAPDPLMRFDLPAPTSMLFAPSTVSVPVPVPVESEAPVTTPVFAGFPPPSLDDAAERILERGESATGAERTEVEDATGRPGRGRRLVFAAVAAAGVAIAAGAAAISLL